MTSERGLNDHERGILQLVKDGGDQASWYWLAKRLPLRGLPLVPDLRAVLKQLLARGLVGYRSVGNGMDRWWLTPEGEAAIGGGGAADGGVAGGAEGERAQVPGTVPVPVPSGPLDAGELAALVAAMRKDVIAAMQAVQAQAIGRDSVRLWQALKQAVAAAPEVAVTAVTSSVGLADAERGPFLRELAVDPRPAVRAAVFDAFAPPRTEVAGEAVRPLPDGELDELLRGGLMDEDPGVRTLAAKLAFGTARGGSVVGELIAQLGEPERELRWWAILALSSAHDAVSLELLVQTLRGPDETMAGAATRALAARPEGHAPWLASLQDPRESVRDAATFALGRVAAGLSDEALKQLAADVRPRVREALGQYLRRASGGAA